MDRFEMQFRPQTGDGLIAYLKASGSLALCPWVVRGDEAFWGDVLGLHKAIQGTAFGGVATPDLKIDGVSPKTALAVGLKVDVEALPRSLVNALNGTPPGAARLCPTNGQTHVHH